MPFVVYNKIITHNTSDRQFVTSRWKEITNTSLNWDIFLRLVRWRFPSFLSSPSCEIMSQDRWDIITRILKWKEDKEETYRSDLAHTCRMKDVQCVTHRTNANTNIVLRERIVLLAWILYETSLQMFVVEIVQARSIVSCLVLSYYSISKHLLIESIGRMLTSQSADIVRVNDQRCSLTVVVILYYYLPMNLFVERLITDGIYYSCRPMKSTDKMLVIRFPADIRSMIRLKR
jgi:hypothetical protein